MYCALSYICNDYFNNSFFSRAWRLEEVIVLSSDLEHLRVQSQHATCISHNTGSIWRVWCEYQGVMKFGNESPILSSHPPPTQVTLNLTEILVNMISFFQCTLKSSQMLQFFVPSGLHMQHLFGNFYWKILILLHKHQVLYGDTSQENQDSILSRIRSFITSLS